MEKPFTPVRTKDDLTPEMVEEILDIHDGFYGDEPRIDWWALLDRVELTLHLDLGGSMDSDAIKAIKAIIRKHRRDG